MNQDHGVRLRDYRPEDEKALAEGVADAQTRRFLPFSPSTARGTAYAISSGTSDELMGGIGLDHVDAARSQATVSLWVGPWARSRGIATAALRAFSEQAFGTGLQRLELLIHWENPIAQRVALAAGYTREGERRGGLPNASGGRDDVLVYARLAGDSGEPGERLIPDLPGGELTDGVVTLRPLVLDDLDFYHGLHLLPEVVASRVPPEPPTAEEMRRRCERADAHWIGGSRAELVILDAATGQRAGEIAFYYIEPMLGQAMIGYSMLPAFRGRGLVTRAAQLVALWAFAETGIARLIAGTVRENLGSQRVLEKAGFHREGVMRSRLPGPAGTRVDDVQFVLLAEDLLQQVSDDATG
ncbi:GNAT family N-acetyltransferase [Actinoplanes sp. NPDC051851]|uniref:GNAT family N-acetyltransferase n=1 Tax=Actinoplanes sp. NPDC051851 TaxID=3154753 RepID=UPI0034499959